MNETNKKYQEDTEAIIAELEYWTSKPRNSYTEKKVKKLLIKAGYPVTAKKLGRRRIKIARNKQER